MSRRDYPTVHEVFHEARANPGEGTGRQPITRHMLSNGNAVTYYGDLRVPTIEHLDAKIVERVLKGGKLDMGAWHCGTVHCRGGWAVAVAGKTGRELEVKVGTEIAAALIYHASTGSIPDFSAMQDRMCDDDNVEAAEIALADMLAGAALDPLPTRRKLRVTGERRARSRGHGERRGRPTPRARP